MTERPKHASEMTDDEYRLQLRRLTHPGEFPHMAPSKPVKPDVPGEHVSEMTAEEYAIAKRKIMAPA